jgi:two-component system, OmpR family, phosphate regulon response regulator PhoB
MAHAPTLLILDPDVALQEQLTRLLTRHYVVQGVATIEAARQVIATQPPAIFVLELDLPQEGSMEFLRLLRQDPRLKDLIIVCLTRRASVQDKVQAFQAGTSDYVVKPFPSTFLTRLILLQRIQRSA